MSWPTLAKSIKYTDWSWYQHQDDGTAWDPAEFVELHPEIDLYILRACWPSGAVDPHFTTYYDGFEATGKKVGAYVWPNTNKPIAETKEDWKVALDGRVPRLLIEDFENHKGNAGVDPKALTYNARVSLEAGQAMFPNSTVAPYTRGYWWDANILHGWEGDYEFMLAHYPYLVYDLDLDKWRLAHTFEESDPCLPVDNNFTPYRGKNVQLEQVIGWQLSHHGVFAPINNGRLDFGYFRREIVERIYDPLPTDDEIKVFIEAANIDRITVAAPDFTVLERV
jgi:hypothetical protein